MRNWIGANPYPQLERGRSTSPPRNGPIHIRNHKVASPHPQLERGDSVSLVGKGTVCIPNWKRANPYLHWERGQAISQTAKDIPHILNWKGAAAFSEVERGGGYAQPERGLSISPTRNRRVHIPKCLGHANCPPPWPTFAPFYTQKEQCKKLPFFERVFSRPMKLGVQNTLSTLLLHDG